MIPEAVLVDSWIWARTRSVVSGQNLSKTGMSLALIDGISSWMAFSAPSSAFHARGS